MTIDIDALFTKIGKAIGPAKALNDSIRGDFANKIADFKNAFTNEPLDVQAAADAMAEALAQLRASGADVNELTTSTPIRNLIRAIVDADNPQPRDEDSLAFAEIVRQMASELKTLKRCTPTVSITNASPLRGAAAVGLRSVDGQPLQFLFPETLRCESDGNGAVSVNGALAVPNPLDPLFLDGGSGISSSLSVRNSDGSLLTNGGFEVANDTEARLPDGWSITAGSPDVVQITNVEVQTITIVGSPTGGWYALIYTDRDGNQQQTEPIPFDGDASAVAAALSDLAGLEDIEVSTTGDSPNFSHTVTFENVADPGQLSSDVSLLTGGTPAIAHATPTAASSAVVRGARALQVSSDGVSTITLGQLVALQPSRRYAINVWAKSTISEEPTGLISLALVDGVGGSIIQDDAGNDNRLLIPASTITTDFAGFGAVFTTPARMPAAALLEVSMITPFNPSNPFWLDELTMVEPTELYTGGPVMAVFEGPDGFAAGDEFSVAIGNDRAGQFITWLDRIYGLRSNGLDVPPTANVPNVPDSLIP